MKGMHGHVMSRGLLIDHTTNLEPYTFTFTTTVLTTSSPAQLYPLLLILHINVYESLYRMELSTSIDAIPGNSDVINLRIDNTEVAHPSVPNENPCPPDSPDTCEAPLANCKAATSSSAAAQRLTPPPEASKVLCQGETPYKLRISQTPTFRDSKLELQRAKIAEEHQYIQSVSLQQFRRHVLPTSVSKKIGAIVKAINVKTLKEEVKAERTANSKAVETDFFKHIATICERVEAAGRKVLKRNATGVVKYTPTKAPKSLDRNNSSIPDCNIALAKSTSCMAGADTENVYHCDIFTTCEFKKGKTPTNVYEVRISLFCD
jgi:hypothetical protein